MIDHEHIYIYPCVLKHFGTCVQLASQTASDLCSQLSMEGPQEVNHASDKIYCPCTYYILPVPLQRPSWRTNLSESLIDCNLLPENQSARCRADKGATLLGRRCDFEGELFLGGGDVSPI